MPEDTEELALTLNGKKRKLTQHDFIKAMTASGLDDKVIKKMYQKFRQAIYKWLDIINDSFLPTDMQKAYKRLIISRALRIKYPPHPTHTHHQ